jgi:ATP-dependent DNA helicase RecG
MDLAQVVRRPEGKTLEFKRDFSSPDKILRTLIAFANTAGGTLLVGVSDAAEVVGVASPLDLEERLASTITDAITPQLLPDIEILKHRDTHVLAVIVHPSQNRPHYLKSKGPTASWVRVGSTNRQADESLLEEMRRFSRGTGFDELPAPDADASDLDRSAAAAAFEGVRELRPRDLESLRLLTRHQGRLVPTNGGLLLFGRDRLERFPDAWIQAARFAGNDRAEFVDRAELRGPLTAAIEEAAAFVAKHSTRGAVISAVRRRDVWNVPPAAIREALINAVAHTDYAQQGTPIRLSIHDDRIEIENPGLLPFGLTLEDLPMGISKLRNRVIGRVLNELGLVEQWGSGVQPMLAACADAGLPAPKWEEVGLRVRVTIPTRTVAEPRLDAMDRTILGVLEHPEGRSTGEVAAAIGLSARATRTRLAQLVERGMVREVGRGPRDPQRRYHRSRN